MLVSNTHKFVYYHIPKTGGVSARESLKQYQDIGPDDYVDRLSRKIGGRQVWFVDALHINQQQAHELYDLKDYIEFTIVREPLARLISLYNYGNNSTLFKSFNEFMHIVEKHYEKPNRLREIYNSQLYWITDKTVILKLEDVILNPTLEFQKVNIDVSSIAKENVSSKIKYKPTDNEIDYCLNFLTKEYEQLNYTKP